jgi:hypothetical protein
VLQAADEALDLTRSYLGSGEVQWNTSSECQLRGSEPPACLGRVSFEQLHGSPKDARGPHQPVRFFGGELSLSLPACERPGWDLDQLRNVTRREPGVSLKAAEGGIPKPLPDLAIQSQGLVGAQPQQSHIKVALGTAGPDPGLDFSQVRRSGTGPKYGSFSRSCHMA